MLKESVLTLKEGRPNVGLGNDMVPIIEQRHGDRYLV